MIWFTSDTHFGHEKVMGYNNRPFSSVQNMEEAFISNWNERVNKSDCVYHLGDFAFSNVDVDKILSLLNGTKILILGNHDRNNVKKARGWAKVCHYEDLSFVIQGERARLILFHYPIEAWNAMHYGSYMIHGHCHGRLPNSAIRRLDVGVDCRDYQPISLEEIHQKLREAPL